MKCLHAMYELEESFAKATMCGSFRRATPFIEYLHNYTEEKDQMFFFTYAILCSHRWLSVNKINVFCLLIANYDIIRNLKIKEKIMLQILCLSI